MPHGGMQLIFSMWMQDSDGLMHAMDTRRKRQLSNKMYPIHLPTHAAFNWRPSLFPGRLGTHRRNRVVRSDRFIRLVLRKTVKCTVFGLTVCYQHGLLQACGAGLLYMWSCQRSHLTPELFSRAVFIRSLGERLLLHELPLKEPLR